MWLVFRSGGDEGRAMRAMGERFIIGRDASCNLVVNDDRCSRQHAFLKVYPDGRAELHDMGSANGTFVNGHRLTGPVLLQGNEQLQFGDVVLGTSITEPSAKATQIGVVPADLRGPSESTIERVKLRRATRTATIVGGLGIAAAVALGALFFTGVLGGGKDEPKQASVADIVAKVTPSTVVIFAEDDAGIGGSGTGWVLDAAEGLIVTNGHVVNAGSRFAIGVNGQRRDATLLADAPCEDLAVLKVADTSGLVTLPLGSQSTVRLGDEVVVVGFPGSASQASNLTATEGVVSVVQTKFDIQALDVPQYSNVLQTDAAINPGNSGGPLVNVDGELVGVNSAGITDLGGRTIQGQGYAIGVDRVKEIVATLRQGRSIAWTGMSFSYSPDPADPNRPSGLPSEPGLVVTNVVPGSAAEAAGFGGTPVLITAVNGQPMNGSLPAYCAAIASGSPESATFTATPVGISSAQEIPVKLQGPATP
jgi:S1-C subfamily serine protease